MIFAQFAKFRRKNLLFYMTIIKLWIDFERLQQTVLPNNAYRSQKQWLTKIRSVSCKSRIIMQKNQTLNLSADHSSRRISHIGSTLNKGA